MTQARRGGIQAVIVVLGLLFSLCAQAQDDGWEQYKQRFLLPDGRIIDTGNNNVSHTEGQGFAMLLAVYNNDRPTFDKIWQWTRSTLYRSDIGLFSWRFEPGKADPITDKNTATDGDIFIAWALLEADKKWGDRGYHVASAQIQKALLRHTVVNYAGYHVMLPGVSGFKQTEAVIVNPSYFIFPAWQAFYQDSHLLLWKTLREDGLSLIGKMQFGKTQLPTDWVALEANGQMAPASAWPPRFGFDAVRVPLYVHWYQNNSPLLRPFASFWRSHHDHQAIPAWIDVLSGKRAEYNQNQGMSAVRNLVLGNRGLLTSQLDPGEDYYSASLYLLTYWSQRSLFDCSPAR
jgi:endoglucanase